MSSAVVARADNGTGVGQARCFGINSCKGQSPEQPPRTVAPGKTPARAKVGLRSATKDVLPREVRYSLKKRRNRKASEPSLV
jgi:hypothetical protein